MFDILASVEHAQNHGISILDPIKGEIGTKDEMAKFQAAFVKCMDKPCAPANGATLRYHPALNLSELHRGEFSFA